MKVVRLDSKKRLVLPGGKAGDLVAVDETGDGLYTLTRIVLPEAKRMDKTAALRAMTEEPLELTLGWDELRNLTREP